MSDQTPSPSIIIQKKNQPSGEIVFSGFLYKGNFKFNPHNTEGSNWKTWKNRWFEIYSEGDVIYKKTQEEVGMLNSFNIKNTQFSETDEKGKPFCVKIQKPDQKFFYVCANTTTEYNNLKKKIQDVGCRLVDDKTLVKVMSQKVIQIKQKNQRPKTRLESVGRRKI
jgi:hypothetical protein